MQLSPPSRHSIPLWSKYSPQHPVLKHSQFMFLSPHILHNNEASFRFPLTCLQLELTNELVFRPCASQTLRSGTYINSGTPIERPPAAFSICGVVSVTNNNTLANFSTYTHLQLHRKSLLLLWFIADISWRDRRNYSAYSIRPYYTPSPQQGFPLPYNFRELFPNVPTCFLSSETRIMFNVSSQQVGRQSFLNVDMSGEIALLERNLFRKNEVYGEIFLLHDCCSRI
jgi:hypothetical protein